MCLLCSNDRVFNIFQSISLRGESDIAANEPPRFNPGDGEPSKNQEQNLWNHYARTAAIHQNHKKPRLKNDVKIL